MSLTSAYEAFLAFPNATHLSDDSSLNYIITLTTVNGSAAITKHVSQQQRIAKRKTEKVLSSIESDNAICLDVETTLEFISGGGAYLPGLDDNFLSDRVVTFPIVHIVHFDNNHHIKQIRLYWDQGSLLKLVDVIGSRAANWPIRDGKDQARLIASSASHTSGTHEGLMPTTKRMGDVAITSKPPSPRKNVTGDPHASLSLFDPREENQHTAFPQAVAPRASAKPAPRDYHDLFPGNESDASPASKAGPPSPAKDIHNVFPTKGGAGKNFKPSRLFDTDEPENSKGGSPQKGMRANPQMYNHFEFADGVDDPIQQPSSKPRPANKHGSQWDFADFSTPEKVPQKFRPQDARNFGWGDEETNSENPTKNTKAVQSHRGAEAQFGFQQDDMANENRRPGASKGQGSNNMGLYKNNLYDDTELSKSPEKKPNAPTTITNLKDRKKDFEPHFQMTDSSPGLGEKTASQNNRPIAHNRNKSVKGMEAQWVATDVSPAAPAQTKPAVDKEKFEYSSGNVTNTKIKTAGDGMGGRKGTGRNWGFGDESDEDGEGGMNAGKFMASKKQQAPKEDSFWDY
ncbi:hypothetical protein MMC26_000253 [Xylographa opegraphella]|nr:hypothetical protein [Xylographa opegraphella]